MSSLRRWWHRAFLERRPSVSLGLFRLAVAVTVGCHVLPSFFHMADNYLATAFKTKNAFFFPSGLLRLVDASPDWVVWSFAALLIASLASFALGYRAQLSAILLLIACDYFYALNSFHIGTLSFDILLVTLVLMCITGYHGDFLSLDSLRRGKDRSYRQRRPFFLQRLLQLQLAWTYGYTALSKITAGGNWLTGNPYYVLMRYPPIGVVREFPGRQFLAQQPELCYGLGVALLLMEFALPVLWFLPRTRALGLGLGFVFHLLLWATLHVPTIFLLLFPPMMLLFIPPEAVVQWIERRQERQAARGRAILLYDGQCGFCLESVARLRALDLFGWVDPLDVHRQPDLTRLHPSLTPQRCRSEMVLVEPDGRLSGGFDAFVRLTRHLPLLLPLAPLVRLPGAAWAGARAYRWVAAHRYLLHRNPACRTNQCALPSAGNGASSGNGTSAHGLDTPS